MMHNQIFLLSLRRVSQAHAIGLKHVDDMEIRELTFLDSKDLQKLRDVARMDVAKYIKSIDEKKKKGIKINKPYQELYDKIKFNMPYLFTAPLVPTQSPIQPPKKDPIEISLEPVPIDELKFHFLSDTNIVERLKTGGIKNLGQLYGSSMQKIERINNVGPSILPRIQAIKDAVSQNPNGFIDAWQDSLIIHELPSNYNRSLGLEVNLRNAIIEYAQVIEAKLDNARYIENSQKHKTYQLLAAILRQFYLEKRSTEQISQNVGYTRAHIEITKNKCISDIISGAIFFYNYRLNQSMIDLIQSLKDECLFDPIQKFKVYSGSSAPWLLSDLGLDTLDILDNGDVTLLIPKDTKGIYRTVWQVINQILQDNPLPTDIDVIYQLVTSHEDLADIEYDTLFVEKILANDKIVENKGNHTIQIKNDYLSSVAQRYARIIYEADHKMTTDEVRAQYEAVYKSTPSAGPNIAGKYGVSCEGKKYWYYGQPRIPIQKKISDYAEDKEVFYYVDLEQELLNEGYSIPQAIRVYITNVCVVDNKDKDHFCHKDCIDSHPEYSWRNTNKYGWANWIFNEIKSIILDRKSVPQQEMIDELDKRSQSTDYSSVRQRLQYNNMGNYCGEDKPFIIKDGNVVINQPVYDTTDFETIGLRGVKYAYFKQIRSFVANEVKKAENGRMKLMDIVQLFNETIVDDEPLSRNVIIRAIKDEQQRFSPIDVELVNEKGILYAQWTKQEIVAEPVYSVSPAFDVAEDDHIVEVEQPDNRPNIKYRQIVNWQELTQVLRNELSFFKGWMQYEHYDLDVAIDTFIYFINHSQNANLSKRLPQDLYEYWFASTDGNDRNRYLTDLLLFFEGLLAELYEYRKGSKPHTHGLGELATYFEGLPDMLMYSRDNKGFARIASNLQYNRNKVAHGGYLELSSLETARQIVEYVALFVYVVARYYQK